MICLKYVVILATAAVLAHLGATEADKFSDLPRNEREEVLELLSQVMEATQLSPFKIIHAGLEKIHEESLSQAPEDHHGEIHQQPDTATSNIEFTFGEPKPSNPQGVQTDVAPQSAGEDAAAPKTGEPISAEATKPVPASGGPKEEFEQGSYIDDSDPNNPEEVHMKKRKRVEVSPNGRSEVHEVSHSSQTVDPNSPYKHRSSSSASSSSSYSRSSGPSNKPTGDNTFANQQLQPEMSWPKFPQMAPIPPIPGMPTMPPMPPMPPMPMIPFGMPLAGSGQWRGFYPVGGYPMAGVPGTMPFMATEPMSKRQAKKLARRQMWEARKKQPDAGKQQAHV